MAMFRSIRSILKFNNVRAASRLAGQKEVVIFPDDEMAVCWHPEQNFPYECSKPLPQKAPAAFSPLKISEHEAKATFARKKNNRLIAEECAKLTYTTMHPWFPRSRDKRAKKTVPDRPYL